MSKTFDEIWTAESEHIGLFKMYDDRGIPNYHVDEVHDSVLINCQKLSRLALGYPAVDPLDAYIDYSLYGDPIPSEPDISLDKFLKELDEELDEIREKEE